METEIKISTYLHVEYEGSILFIKRNIDGVLFPLSTTEAIQLRNFLNQLNLEEK